MPHIKVPCEKPKKLEGTNVSEGRCLLQESGLDITPASSLDEGAKLICEAVAAIA